MTDLPTFVPDPRYQVAAAKHLLANRRAGLFMQMGLGKTGTTLLAYSALRKAGRSKGAIVLAPLRVARLQWPAEVAQWANFSHLRIAMLHTDDGWNALDRGDADLYVTNFERIPELTEYLAENPNAAVDTLIIDELSKLKNAQSRRIKGKSEICLRVGGPRGRRVWDDPELLKFLLAADKAGDRTVEENYRELLDLHVGTRRIPGFYSTMSRFERRWGLTGTPASENLLDLYGQIFLLDDGRRLGRTFTAFTDKWFHRPMRRSEDGTLQRSAWDWEINTGAEAEILAAVSDICISFRSADYFDIPPPRFEEVHVPMPAPVAKQYRELERELLLVLAKKGTVESPTAAALSNKLLQICTGMVYLSDADPAFTDEQAGDIPPFVVIHEAKIRALADILARHADEPVLVATNWRHERRTILDNFPDAVEWDDRLLDPWNRKKVPLLVADPRSIGHGLNLQHGGSVIVFFSRPWSRDNYDQFIARLHRRGQRSQVTVYNVLIPDTIEEAQIEALAVKAAGQSRLMQSLSNLKSLRS